MLGKLREGNWMGWSIFIGHAHDRSPWVMAPSKNELSMAIAGPVISEKGY